MELPQGNHYLRVCCSNNSGDLLHREKVESPTTAIGESAKRLGLLELLKDIKKLNSGVYFPGRPQDMTKGMLWIANKIPMLLQI